MKLLKISLAILCILVIAGGILYYFRVKIIGQYVPEINKVYYTDLVWTQDSLKGVVALGIKNKGINHLTIDSVSLLLVMGNNTFLNLQQPVQINLSALEEDTLQVPVALPIIKYIKFLDSIKQQDSTSLDLALTISYSTKVGKLNLPIKQHVTIEAPRRLMGQIVNVKYDKYKDKILYMNLNLYLYNPGKLNFDLNDIKCTVQVSSDITATGSYKKVAIVPGQSTSFTLPLQAKFDKPGETIMDIIKNEDIYNYSMLLTATLESKSGVFDGMDIIIRKNGNIELVKQSEKKEKKGFHPFRRKKKDSK